MSKEELLKYLIAEIDLIMHDKDYRFENADGTWYSRESCRDLTNEEVFEELKTELRQLADLETKLAESEKEVEFYKERYSDATTSAYGADLMAKDYQWHLEKEIEELKQQLAEREKEIEDMKDHQKDLCLRCGGLTHEQYEQDKINFAVAKLEKVKEKLRQNITITAPANELKKLTDYLIGVDDYIDQQIKKLKGE